MKTILKESPWMKVLFYFLALSVALYVAGIIPALNDFWFFLLISLLCSWVLLKTEGKALTALHLLPASKQHWLQWGCATIAGCGLLIVTTIITISVTGDSWNLRTSIDPVYIIMVFLNCLWSSLVQEIAFRGYPFQTLLKNYGTLPAQLIVAVPFALMHMRWGMSPEDMATILLTTGLGSILFGLAFIRTRNLAAPIGLHMGWNLGQALIPRTSGSTNTTLIVVSGDTSHYTFFNVVVPYIAVMVIAIGLSSLIQLRTKQ